MALTNNIRIFGLCVGVAVLAAISCGEQDLTEQSQVPIEEGVSINSVEFGPKGGECNFTVASQVSWELSNLPDWVSISDSHKTLVNGSSIPAGLSRLCMKVAFNNQTFGQGTYRESSIFVGPGHIDIKQASPYLDIQVRRPGNTSFEVLGTEDDINYAWNYTSEQPFTDESNPVVLRVRTNIDCTIFQNFANSTSVILDSTMYQRPSCYAVLSTMSPFVSGILGGWLSSPEMKTYRFDGDSQFDASFIPQTYNATGQLRSAEVCFMSENSVFRYDVNFSQAAVRFNVTSEAPYTDGRIEMPACKADDVKMNVDSEIDWYVDGASPWIAFTPARPKADGCNAETPKSSFYFNIEHEGCKEHANSAETIQDGAFTIYGKTGNRVLPMRVNVRQAAYNLTVSTNSENFSNTDDKTCQVQVLSSGDWSVIEKPSWINVSDGAGTGDPAISKPESFTVNVNSRNWALTPRTGKVVVASALNGIKKEVAVSQDAYLFEATLSTTSINTISTSACSATVRSYGDWRFEVTYDNAPEKDWLSAYLNSSRNDQIIYKAKSYNLSDTDRIAYLKIYSSEHEKAGISLDPLVFKIVQRKYTFEVSPWPKIFEFEPVSKETYDIKVECSDNWSVTGSSWISVENKSGSGDGTITLSAQNNTNHTERTGTITIKTAYKGSTKTYTVKQKAFVFNVVSPTSITMQPVANSDITVGVECSSDWTVSSSVSWITPSLASGTSSNKSVRLKVDDNFNKYSRCGTIRIRSIVSNETVNISFAQNPLVFDQETYRIEEPEYSGGDYYYDFSCSNGVRWSVANVPSWVKVSPSSGTGSARMRIHVDPNYELESRSGSFQIVCSQRTSIKQNCEIINQKAFRFDNVSVTVPTFSALNASEVTVPIGESDLPWELKNVPSWLNATKTADGVVFKPEDNTGNYRSVLIRVESDAIQYNSSLVKQIVVSQAEYFLKADKSSLSFNASDNSAVTVNVECTGTWKVSASETWVTVTPSEKSFEVNVDNNTSTSSRTATITITADGNRTTSVSVTQAGKTKSNVK